MAGNLENAKKIFNDLNKDRMDLIDQFYDKTIVFQDPIHKLDGVDAVKKYYSGLYQSVQSIRFEFGQCLEAGNSISMEWKMYLKTPNLQGGDEITVDGVSNIVFNPEGKAIYHRDYFDMGEFIYERVPLLKSVIHFIKAKLAG